MITQQFRPTTFDEVVGQDLNVKILKSLVAKPEEAPRSLILYGEYGCGKCVPGDIRILTENGYLKIGDYCKGIDEGFTECKGETEGRFGKDKIVAKYFEREALVRTVNLNVNNNVRGTLRHKVLAFKDGEIGLFPLGNLKIGDYILFPKKPIEFKNAKHCPELAYAQAVWLSDGWCSKDKTAAGYCGSLKACKKFKRIVGWRGKLSKDKRKEDVYNIRSSLKDKMKIEIMHGAGNKYVPEWIFNTDVETRKAFIQGLFDTDGCISKNQFELMSKSEKLVKGYQELFMSLGVATKIIPKTLTTGRYKGNVYYKIYIKNHSLQDFKWTSRQFILEDKNTANSRNVISVTRRMTEELEHYVKGRKTSRVRAVLHNLRVGRCVTERTLINLKNELGYLPSCFDELIGYTYAKILSYTDTVEDVYDITTEKYHEFYAQGTYNHNTTCARIFAREINHDNTVDLDTTPYYMELDSAAMGSIDHIRELRDTFAYSSGSFYKIVVFDECLHYNSSILVRDENKKEHVVKIGFLYSKQPKGWEALSYNKHTDEFEWKPIVRYIKTGRKEFYRVTIQTEKLKDKHTKRIITTLDHKYFRPNGEEVYLRDLKVGDSVLTVSDFSKNKVYSKIASNKNSYYCFSDEVKQFFRGSILGDGTFQKISINSEKARYRINQSIKHTEYIDVIKSFLNEIVSCTYLSPKAWGTEILCLGTKSIKEIGEIYSEFYYDKNKYKITKEFLDKLTPLSIAVWYMDDGSLQHNHGKEKVISLSTHSYSKEENLLIIKFFEEKYRIFFRLGFDKRCQRYYLYTSGKENLTKIFELVSPYLLKCFQHKLGFGYKAQEGLKNLKPVKRVIKNVNGIVSSKGTILSIEPYKDDRPYGYDITVEDNHNYISGDVVLHNCHLISSAGQAALLKIIEEAPKKVFFIFATTNPEKLLKTIRSRSIELKFDGISKEEMFKNLKNISQELNKEVPDNVIDVICKRSRGHMRNAHMLLDKYFLIGHDAFVQSVRTAHPYIYLFLESIAKKDKETCFKAIDSILKFPLVTVQQDFQEVLADMTKAMVNYPPYAEQSKKINSLFGANTLKIIKFLLAPWILEDSFKSDLELQTGLLCVFQILTKSLR